MFELNPLVFENRRLLHPVENLYNATCLMAETIAAGYVAGKLFARLSGGTGLAMAAIQAPVYVIAQRGISNLDKKPLSDAVKEHGLLAAGNDPRAQAYQQKTRALGWMVTLAPLLARAAGYQVTYGEIWGYWIGAGLIYPVAQKLLMSQVVDRLPGRRFFRLPHWAANGWPAPIALEKIEGIELNQAKISEPPPEIVLEDLPDVDPHGLVYAGGKYYLNISNALNKMRENADADDAYTLFAKLMRNLTSKLLKLPENEQKIWLEEMDDAFAKCGSQWQQVAERIYLRLTIPGGSAATIIAEQNHELKKQIIRGWGRIQSEFAGVHFQHMIQKELQYDLGLRFVGADDPEAVVNQQLGGNFLFRMVVWIQSNTISSQALPLLATFHKEYTAERLVQEHMAVFGEAKGDYYTRFRDFLYAEVAGAAGVTEAQAQNLVHDQFFDEIESEDEWIHKLNSAAIIFALKRTGDLVDDGVIVHGKKNEEVLPQKI